MKEIKLFTLLKSISKEEFAELYDFITSPIVNKDTSIIILYDFINDNYESALANKIPKEIIYKTVFNNEKFNESKYWKLTSGLSILIDKFLVYKVYDKDIYYQKNLLLEAYRTRNVHKQFETLSKDLHRSFKNEFNKGLSFYLNQTHFYFQKLSYLGPENIDEFDHDLKNLFDNLKMFFIMTNITSVSIISNFKESFPLNAGKDVWLFNEIMEYLNRNKEKTEKENHIVYIFYLIIQSKLDFSNEKYFYEIKKRISINKNKFSKNLLRHILINMLSYAMKKFISGNENFSKEIFYINKIMDENSLTLFGEFIQGSYFYSVVENSAMINELEWAEEFIEKYSRYLTNDYKESGLNLSMARLNFELMKFDSSLLNLLKVDNLDPYFYLSHKVLLLQNYYETKNYEAIDSILQTTNKFLKRRIDISDELKDNYLKFFKFFKKLKSASTIKKYQAKSLYKELNSEYFFIYKKWLLKKSKAII